MKLNLRVIGSLIMENTRLRETNKRLTRELSKLANENNQLKALLGEIDRVVSEDD